MSIETQYDREVAILEREFDEGAIDRIGYIFALARLDRERREMEREENYIEEEKS